MTSSVFFDPKETCDQHSQKKIPKVLSLQRIFAIALIAAIISLVVCCSSGLHATHQGHYFHVRNSAQQEPQNGGRRLFSLSGFSDPKSVTQRDVPTITSIKERYYIPNLSPYNHQHIMMTQATFSRELFLLIYDPNKDAFHIHIDQKKDKYYSNVYSPIFGRLNAVLPVLTSALRVHFAHRFQGPNSPEFMIFFSTGDTPKLRCRCVNEEERVKRPVFCQNALFAPILQFGSVYKDIAILPNLVTMPVWSHIPCFREWQRDGTVCMELKLRSDVAGVLGGKEALKDLNIDHAKQKKIVWDTLLPTLVWRGSDFFFLNCIHDNLLRPEWDRVIAPRIAHFGNNARGVMSSILELWDNLYPRWKAVILAVLAELDAQEMSENNEVKNTRQVPWIDAKFTVKSKVHGQHVEPKVDMFLPFRDYGMQMTSEEMMSLADLSKYKYHIDIGGGGGTTWSGTIEKLAMPGVLFHHVTSSKDYYHDDLIPWVHYIPIKEDLSNLREMYDWAEANTEDARKISEAGTQYVKQQATPYVMKATYERYFIHSLKRVVDAYQPIEGEEATGQMKEWLSKWSTHVGTCTGGYDKTCDFKNWRVQE